MICDFVFTEIFSNPKNIKIVEHFLAAYFDKHYDELHGHVKIQQRDLELDSRFAADKQVDLIIDLKSEKINVEMARCRSSFPKERNYCILKVKIN